VLHQLQQVLLLLLLLLVALLLLNVCAGAGCRRRGLTWEVEATWAEVGACADKQQSSNMIDTPMQMTIQLPLEMPCCRSPG
jgi:hypothetical protein